MRKILLSILCVFISYTISFADNWDILSVKFMHSPVLTSTDESAKVIWLLQKWYVVLDLWVNWDYTHIMLTDGKKWYMLSSYLENYTFNNYKINGNKWSIQTNTAFYSQPHSSSKQLWTLIWGSEFYILHVNYINSKFLKIKIINGPHKNKTWYIESNNVNISHLSDFKSEIQKFIEKYAKDQSTLLYLNNSTAEYQPLFEGDELGNTVSVFQKQNKNSSWNTSSTTSNISWNILNSNSTTNNWSTTQTSSSNNTSTKNNSTSPSTSDIDDFLNLLNLDKYTSTGTTSSSSSSSSSTKNSTWWSSSSSSSTKTNNGSTSNTQNNNDINDFLNLLNLDKYLSGSTNTQNNSSNSNTNTQSNNDINDFLNLLNLDQYTSTGTTTSSSNTNEDVNTFLDALNKSINTSSGTSVSETQQNDIENFLKLLNNGL